MHNLVVLRVSLLFVKKKTIHFLKENFHKFTPSFFSCVRGMLPLLCDLIVVVGVFVEPPVKFDGHLQVM